MNLRQIEERLHTAEAKILSFLKVIEPEARIFIMDNLPIVKTLVMTAEHELVGQPGGAKFSYVLDALGKESLKLLPDVVVRQSWLHFAIELAVLILQATGELK